MGQLVAREIERAGGVAKEFNTIAVDDGIAMGHDGMLYSLPSRELIADSVEYMVNAHCADALVCISNCDKITPGMLMAALRLNIPVCSSPAGRWKPARPSSPAHVHKLDLIDAMVMAADPTRQRRRGRRIRAQRLPDLRLLLRHVHRQLDELPDRSARAVAARQRHGAGHPRRPRATVPASRAHRVELRKRYYERRRSVLPRNIANFEAFENAMTLDIAMGGSTNTVLHLLAAAQEAEVDFTMADIDRLSRKRAATVQGGAEHPEVPHGGRAPRRRHHGDPRRTRRAAACCTPTCHRAQRRWRRARALGHQDRQRRTGCTDVLPRRPGRHPDPDRLQPGHRWPRWTTTAPRAASADRNTPIRRKAASPCCTATSREMAAW
jgi:hypothetical protein